jgi:protein MpaA
VRVERRESAEDAAVARAGATLPLSLWFAGRYAVVLYVALLFAAAGCAEPLRPMPSLPPRPAPASVPVVEARPDRVETVGRSVKGAAIDAFFFGSAPYDTLIFAGIHGDERIAADVATRLVDHLRQHPEALAGRGVIVIPRANPDGLAAGTRVNARKIDLNRNFPASNFKPTSPRSPTFGGTKAASEPETQALIRLVDAHRPRKIVSIHAMHRGPCNNYDGPSEALAKAMGAINGYPVLASIGYPTPGSFGTWAGIDRKIPTVTLELPSRGKADAEWPKNRDALLAAIRHP